MLPSKGLFIASFRMQSVSKPEALICQQWIGAVLSKSHNPAQRLRGLGKQASVLGVFLDDIFGLGDLHCVI